MLKGVGDLTEGRTNIGLAAFLLKKISAEGKSSENQATSGFAGIKAPKTNTFKQRLADPGTGELRAAQIFVAVLGASAYTYVEAAWSQSLPDWIGSHVRAFTFFGGCYVPQ